MSDKKETKGKSTLFTEKDADISVLKGKTITVIGYGNQGRAQSLNMKDSGLNVIVGNRSDRYKELAEADGIKVHEIPEAVKLADVVFILTPDETMPDLYSKSIAPNLKVGATVCIASGYNFAFGHIKPAKNINAIMIAPRMIGKGVRERFLSGEGYISYISVFQDATGAAKEIMLALSQALGTLKRSAIEVSAKQEAELDLFMEQSWMPAFNRVIVTAIRTLMKFGLPAEAILTEIYMSEELAYTGKEMANLGMVTQTNLHSHTSQYGTWSRTKRFSEIDSLLCENYEKTLKEITSGKFAKEWKGEKAKRRFHALKHLAMNSKVVEIENDVRKNLGMKDRRKDMYYPPSNIDEILKSEDLKDDIENFTKSLDGETDTGKFEIE